MAPPLILKSMYYLLESDLCFLHFINCRLVLNLYFLCVSVGCIQAVIVQKICTSIRNRLRWNSENSIKCLWAKNLHPFDKIGVITFIRIRLIWDSLVELNSFAFQVSIGYNCAKNLHQFDKYNLRRNSLVTY